MTRTKLFASILLSLAILVAQISPALAAPAYDDATPAAPITGTVQSITVQTDSTGATTVTVTITDETNATQTVTLSLETATSLGLVTTDETGATVANDAAIGQSVTVDPTSVLPPTEEGTTPQNPVSAVLSAFFGIDYDTLEGYHEDGVGYGVIAQSCWLSYSLAGDSSMCGAIIEAKQSGDFSSIVLPDGTTATNWGQFKKAVEGHKDPLQTLGAIMSGHAKNESADGSETDSPEDATVNAGQGTGMGQGNGPGGNGNGQGNGQGQNPGQGQGNGKDKDKGNGNGNGHGHNK